MMGSSPACTDKSAQLSRQSTTSRRRCRTSSTQNASSSQYHNTVLDVPSCLSTTFLMTLLLTTSHLTTAAAACGGSSNQMAFTSLPRVNTLTSRQGPCDRSSMSNTATSPPQHENTFFGESRRSNRGGLSTPTSPICFHFRPQHSQFDAAISSTSTFFNRLLNIHPSLTASKASLSSTSSSSGKSSSRWGRKLKGRNLKSSSTAQSLNARNDVRADPSTSLATYKAGRHRRNGSTYLASTRERQFRKSVLASMRPSQHSSMASCRVPPLSSLMMNGRNNDISEQEAPLNSTESESQTLIRKSKPPLTESDYQLTKNEWAAKYTSLSTLRSQFGTNRNRFWGDFDMTTSRKLYHTLLPRALLGLYEMGLWRVQDLAPLAFEARVAAKKYARERCIVPGRVMAMVYDGFRSWRDWGTWNVEGMSWEQIWFKYETQILQEYMMEEEEGLFTPFGEDEEGLKLDIMSDGSTKDRIVGLGGMTANELEEEITAQICFRILEKSCTTNASIDKLLLQDLKESPEFKTRNRGKRKKRILRRRNAERDIAKIASKLERDMEELLESNKQLQLSSSRGPNSKPNFLDLVGGSLSNRHSGSGTSTATLSSAKRLLEFARYSPQWDDVMPSKDALRLVEVGKRKVEDLLLPFSIL